MSTEFTLFAPPAPLTRDVQVIRVSRSRGGRAFTVRVCPNGTPGIVFQRGEAGPAIESIATRSGLVTGLPPLFLHGAGSEPSEMTFVSGEFATIQVALRPHALPTLFGKDALTLAAQGAGAEAFGASELESRLLAASDDVERVDCLWDFLTVCFERAGIRDELVERSLEIIHREASVGVNELLERIPLSARQFEKRFAATVGLTPQKYIRVRRVNEALRLIQSGEYERLSDVAYELDFYDQAHFIHEIKAFSWLTPTAISQKTREFQQDLTGFSYS